MSGFLSSFHELVDRVRPDSIHEVGCGEGHLTTRLASRGYDIRGSDVSEQAIAEARQRNQANGTDVDFHQKSIYDLEEGVDSAPLMICCEVLEHLDRPGEAMSILTRLAEPYLLLSVPREPLWHLLNLARFRYVTDFGNTPGHVQHWSGRGFKQFVGNHAEIVEQRHPLPWTMVLCKTPNG